MPRVNPYGQTPVIFLAMFWGGGGPYTIPNIIHVYDWINRAIPTRGEMEAALNELLALGLIERHNDNFSIPKPQYRAFDEFKKKKRKNKFDLARMYFGQLPVVAEVPRVIELTEAEHEEHIKAYRKDFAEALKRSR